jgi:menaquinone-specific isochorismate synthase
MKTNNPTTIKHIIKTGLFEAAWSTAGNGQPFLFNRIQFEIPSLDLIAWLKNQTDPVKIYASDRNHHYEIAGIGAIDILTDCAECEFSALFPEIRRRIAASHQQIKYFGGIAFNLDQDLDNDWMGFGKYYFVVPRFEIVTKNSQTFFACNYRNSEPLSSLMPYLDDMTFAEVTALSAIPTIEKRVDLPQKPGWTQSINQAVHLINTTSLNKVVLSRKTTLSLSDVPSPFDLLSRLKNISTDSFDFCLQPAERTAFLGSTPELLYRRRGRTISSEAIAGTRPRGKTAAEDRAFYDDLANSHKDTQEHLVVVDNVLETLNTLCRRVDVLKRLDILQLSLVQHLYTQFRGELNPAVTDEDILAGLHPTPSVLGEPKKQAFADLANLEPYARGWYAGPLGWIGADEATFVVGIRSGLLHGDKISLFSGAGIVEESDPDKEWEEIENKLGQFMRVFEPEAAQAATLAKPPATKWRQRLTRLNLGDSIA